MNLFQKALQGKNRGRPPVWFMRQAGRYHQHYQNLRKTHSFLDLCRIPAVACEATLGPIREFDFDAAILFSDLLFPLEVMGMGLRYDEGPKLDWHLRTLADLDRLQGGASLAQGLQFQGDAMALIRKELPSEKGLLGFVGGPLTLYCYAVEGRHQGDFHSARAGFEDGRWEGFWKKLRDLLVENILLQARAGADVVAILDTCAGEFDPQTYSQVILPFLSELVQAVRAKNPNLSLAYYSKKTGPSHWQEIKNAKLSIQCLGVDWIHPLDQVLTDWHGDWAIQGNFDPHALFLETELLEKKLRVFFESVQRLPSSYRQGWICGLGHGILPKTPEAHVHLFVRLQKEIFS